MRNCGENGDVPVCEDIVRSVMCVSKVELIFDEVNTKLPRNAGRLTCDVLFGK